MACLRLLLGGDVMLGRGIDQVLPHPLEPTLQEPLVRDARHYVALAERRSGPIPRHAPLSWPWGDALARIAALQPHLRFVNLETAITTAAEPWPGKRVHYRLHPAHAGSLRLAGIDACSLANNHVLDWGRQGLRDTLQALAAAGVGAAGAGLDAAGACRALRLRPRDVPGAPAVRLSAWGHASSGIPSTWAAGARREGVALLPDLAEAGLEAIRRQAPRRRLLGELQVIALHWGGNWVPRLPAEQRRFAHALIDAGLADVVWGHSSHHPLPIEVYRGRVILYGCGDLINDYEGISPGPERALGLTTDLALLHLLELDGGSGRLLGLDLVPLQRRRFRLQSCEPGLAEALREQLQAGCAPLGSALRGPATGPWQLDWSGSQRG